MGQTRQIILNSFNKFDFARPCETMRARATASTASHRAFRDDREPAPRSGETVIIEQVICPKPEANYFLRADYTALSSCKRRDSFSVPSFLSL
jgi:hypothetical protein